MAYTLHLKQRLNGISIAVQGSTTTCHVHKSSRIDIQYAIEEVTANSAASKYGVLVGDTIVSVNHIPFSSLVAKCGLKNPNAILQNVNLPFTVTLARNYDKMTRFVDEVLDEIPDSDEVQEGKLEVDSGDHGTFIPSSSSMDIFSPRYSTNSNFSQRSSISLTQSTTSTATLFSGSNSLSQRLLKHHLIQQHDAFKSSPIHFDTASKTSSNGKVIMVSSKALEGPITEWTIEIDRCDVPIQEIGICGTSDIEGIEINDRGVTETVSLGARGVYGNSLEDDSLWYGSYNKDGQPRCRKDLTPYYRIGWTAKTQIKVSVNLEKWRIRFWINGKKVRKVLSLQPRKVYYPFISFAGNCRYKIL